MYETKAKCPVCGERAVADITRNELVFWTCLFSTRCNWWDVTAIYADLDNCISYNPKHSLRKENKHARR